jgi:hypothetical protein
MKVGNLPFDNVQVLNMKVCRYNDGRENVIQPFASGQKNLLEQWTLPFSPTLNRPLVRVSCGLNHPSEKTNFGAVQLFRELAVKD